MRAMKHSPNIFQGNSNSGPTPFRNFSTQYNKEGFDISPSNIGSLRLLENGFQSFAVFAIHSIIISENDTAIKGCLTQFQNFGLERSRLTAGVNCNNIGYTWF